MPDREGRKKKPGVRSPCCASGDSLVEAIENALSGREYVVMVRVNEELLKQLDMLVDASICRSRSSAATFMIREGVKANASLFGKVEGATSKIAELRASLRETVGDVEAEDA